MSMAQEFVYLASQSPRRRQLLEQIGVAHELLLPGPEEDAESLEAELPGELAHAYVQRVTRLKLEAAVQRWRARGLPPAPILCADTTVTLDERILGKPADAGQALEMLRCLSGRRHQVLTAVAIALPQADGVRMEQALSESAVVFDTLNEARMAAYVQTGEPFGKAGGYGVQGHAATLIARIEGSFSGIMGLPLLETSRLLRAFGWTI